MTINSYHELMISNSPFATGPNSFIWTEMSKHLTFKKIAINSSMKENVINHIFPSFLYISWVFLKICEVLHQSYRIWPWQKWLSLTTSFHYWPQGTFLPVVYKLIHKKWIVMVKVFALFVFFLLFKPFSITLSLNALSDCIYWINLQIKLNGKFWFVTLFSFSSTNLFNCFT